MTEIVTPVPISPMPAAPLLTDTQAVFNTKAFAFVAAWDAFVAQMNAQAVATRTNAVAGDERAVSANASSVSAANSATAAGSARDMAQAFAQSAINAPGTSGTSPSSIGIGSGNKVLTTQAGKAFVVGQTVTVAAASAPTTQRMVGVITSYDAGTGVMNFFVPDGAFLGSGAPSSWIISLTSARDGLVRLGAGPSQLTNAISLGLQPGGGAVRISVDGVDLGQIVLSSSLDLYPVGARGEFYMNAPPPGWFKSNGAGLSVTSYPRLFARIGYYYGGSGDTFYLPNDNGLFSRAWDETGVYDPSRAFGSVQGPANLWHNHGGATGDAGWHNHTGTVDGTGYHGHSGTALNAGGHVHSNQQTRSAGGGGGPNSFKSEDSAGAAMNSSYAGEHTHVLSLSVEGYHAHTMSIGGNGVHAHGIGGDGAAESRPWNRAVLVCIKY